MQTTSIPQVKARELRIGNILSETDRKGRVHYVTMTNEFIGEMELEPGLWDPVPLTAKILEKCGFKKHKDESGHIVFYELSLGNQLAPHGSNHYVFSGLLFPENPNTLIPVAFTVNDFWGSRKIENLHELQNLFFALTGKELQINL
jgi:hypothetical protein